jgi:hypothetical protein
VDPRELSELPERIRHREERIVGLTMAIIAAFLAVVSLMSHRLHTEEVVLQTKVADGWAYYQAKNTRSQMYGSDSDLARLLGSQGASVVDSWKKKADEEAQQADEIRRQNDELDQETKRTAHRATLFDSAEVCLEIGIVLCSVALLTTTPVYWKVALVPVVIGVVLGAIGML